MYNDDYKTDDLGAGTASENEIVKREDRGPGKKDRKPARTSYFMTGLIGAIIGGLLVSLLMPRFMGDMKLAGGDGRELVINTSEDINVVSAVAKANMKSVVGITTVEIVSDYYFFLPREVEGVGSGVIVDPNGYILTNAHVVRDGKAQSLEVLFEDGEKLPGKVLWADSDLDLAVVKVDKTNLPAAKLGDSDSLEVGEIAIAIGNPLGLDFQRSVTAGIISGLNRTIDVASRTMSGQNTMNDLIQTDASINKGNSGGPLFNSRGEVIGINTVKVGNAEGLGFSIPINSTKHIIEEVIAKGHYEPLKLGIKALTAEEFIAAFNIENSDLENLIILEVLPETPAARAGLEQFDEIKRIDNKDIRTREDIEKALQAYKKGDSVEITIVRNHKEMNLRLKF